MRYVSTPIKKHMLVSTSKKPTARSDVREKHVRCGAQHDLLVVGPGVLGSLAGKLWKEAHPEATIVGQTMTINNHDRLVTKALHVQRVDNLSR